MCTECLVSETGSDGYLDIEEMVKQVEMDKALSNHACVFDDVVKKKKKKEPSTGVNYHGSYTANKFFPPPLSSMSRRDGQCVLMKPERKDGHLLLNTIITPSKNYLHCQRKDGRLQLSFVETTFKEIYHEIEDPVVTRQRHAEEAQTETVTETETEAEEEYGEEEQEEEEIMGVEEEEDDEEEVEVVNRGNVVEVKVSCLPQLLTGGMKVHRSSLVINKFVGMPLDSTPMAMETPVLSNETSYTDTAVKKVAEMEWWGRGKNSPTRYSADNKLLFSSKKMMNRQALLHQVRRCGEYNRPLFFWEHCYIATT